MSSVSLLLTPNKFSFPYLDMNWRWRLAQYLELRWWKNYLQDKTPQDYLAWKRTYWQQLFNDTLKDFPVKSTHSIIDFGCGPAGCYIYFTDNQITAIDPLINSYEQLPHFKKANYPGTSFMNSTIEDFQLSGQADIVLCINAINHVNDINKAMQVVCDAVKPNGLIFMSIDAHRNNFVKWLFRLIPGDALHPHQYNTNEYSAMLQSNGITIEKIITIKKGGVFNYNILIGVKQ